MEQSCYHRLYESKPKPWVLYGVPYLSNLSPQASGSQKEKNLNPGQQ